jgi:hypothetical protein
MVTTLRGPDGRLSFLAAPIIDVISVSSITGNVMVAFAVLSYAGRLVVTAIRIRGAAPTAVPASTTPKWTAPTGQQDSWRPHPAQRSWKIDMWPSAGARRRTLGVAGDQRAGQMNELVRTPSR